MQQRPIVYFSGIDREEHIQLLKDEQVAGMVNARNVMQFGLLNAIRNHPHVPLVLDSGYTKKLSLNTYVALLDFLSCQHPGRFRWFVAYDDPTDPTSNEALYKALVARLPHLQEHILWVFHPRWGTREERMRNVERLQRACEKHMTIALGGLVPLVRGRVRDALILLQEIGEIFNAYYPTEAHLLGISSPDLLAWARTQPWIASLDSSRWVRAAKAHEILLLSGEQRKASALHLPLTQEECAALNIRSLQAWVNGPTVQWPGEWMDQLASEKDALSLALSSQERALPTLLRHRGRKVLHMALEGGSPSFDWYIPLFSISRREHGLLAFDHGEPLSLKTDWAVIWDVDRDDPLLPQTRLFLIDGCLKTGLFSHDDVFFPCLCRYPLSMALQVAKSFAPFSSPE